jgi:Mobilization protein NikA
MPEKAVKRRKPKALRKEDEIRVLVTETEKDELTAAANRAGLPVASWLRLVGLQTARQDQGQATKKTHRR